MSIKVKKKLCGGCNTMQFIWKNIGGVKYCKSCSNTGVVSNDNFKPKPKQSFISPRSSKRVKEEAAYSSLRLVFLKQHPICQAKLSDCTGTATEVHHKCGRVGGLLLDSTEWLATCRTCHQWIELNPTDAKKLGLSGSRL